MKKDIRELIREDIGGIMHNISAYDEPCPIERVIAGTIPGSYEDLIRVYVLDLTFGGGVALVGEFKWRTSHRDWTIVMLGEDDGHFFPLDNEDHYLPSGSKVTILDLLGRAMSLMNNLFE